MNQLLKPHDGGAMGRSPRICAGVTIIEVMVSALLIFLGLGAIFSLNTRSLQVLRKTRQFATASQMLQERLEMMRNCPWPQVSRAQTLAALLQTPAPSSRDLADATPSEDILVTIPSTPGQPASNAPVFEVHRIFGQATVVQDGDLSTAPLLVVEASVSWKAGDQTQQRSVRTVIARDGLTRAGIFGSSVGRPARTPTKSP
jgi:Tfp pilus assembly protein PilV